MQNLLGFYLLLNCRGGACPRPQGYVYGRERAHTRGAPTLCFLLYFVSTEICSL